MKKFIFSFLVFTAVLGFAQIPFNFNNQRLLLEQIEENINLISNLTQNILENPFDTPQNKNDFIMNVINKNECVDEITDILGKYFLQKYLSKTDDDFNLKLAQIHKMLNLCFLIKTSVDENYVKNLQTELDVFKNQMKMNFKKDPEYKSYKYKKYRATK